MATEYTIYLVNKKLTDQTFWCFLAAPQITGTSTLFGNSSANLTVEPNSPATNSFGIPLQYSVGAGASNKAVGLNVKIQSYVTEEAKLKDVWDATYPAIPPKKGPRLIKDDSAQSKDGTLQIVTNAYDEVAYQSNSWYTNQTFGIETDAGMVGVTWEPSPATTSTITPKFSFYVTTGTYSENSLADLATVSNTSAVISLKDFSVQREATVTLKSDGNWAVTAGKPSESALLSADDYVRSLIDSHNLLAQSQAELAHAHDELINNLLIDDSSLIQNFNLLPTATVTALTEDEKVLKVIWGKSKTLYSEDGEANEIISGTISVATVVTIAAVGFVVSGVRFNITRNPLGQTSFIFSYSGDRSLEYLKTILNPGAIIKLFG